MEIGIGSKLVCINDTFKPWIFDLYKSLPKKGNIYTVRDIDLGRTDPKFTIDESTDDCKLKIATAKFCAIIWLEELVNPNDPNSTTNRELGFNAERFLPPEMMDEEVKEEVKQPVKRGRLVTVQ